MTTCNCIGRSHPGCCHNRWFGHYPYYKIGPYDYDYDYDNCWKCGSPKGSCYCKEIMTDKEKQQHDLVLQLEERVNKLEKKTFETDECIRSLCRSINNITEILTMIRKKIYGES